jgi:hypothetical protein
MPTTLSEHKTSSEGSIYLSERVRRNTYERGKRVFIVGALERGWRSVFMPHSRCAERDIAPAGSGDSALSSVKMPQATEAINGFVR